MLQKTQIRTTPRSNEWDLSVSSIENFFFLIVRFSKFEFKFFLNLKFLNMIIDVRKKNEKNNIFGRRIFSPSRTS